MVPSDSFKTLFSRSCVMLPLLEGESEEDEGEETKRRQRRVDGLIKALPILDASMSLLFPRESGVANLLH